MNKNFKLFTLGLLAALILSGCGGGGASSGGATVSGTVSAPGGTVAFNQSKNLFARILTAIMPTAFAAVNGAFSSVGGGVTVRLVKVDAANNVIGSPYGTGTTNSDGTFSITLTSEIEPGANYVVQALSGSNVLLQAIYTANSELSVDPVSTVVRKLVHDAAGSNSLDLSSVNVQSVASINSAMSQQLVGTIYSAASISSIADATQALINVGQKVEELSNQINSSSASGVIKGKVTGPDGAAVAGITIGVVDFGNWVLRASTTTNPAGQYEIRAPENKEYIIGVMNRTGDKPYASGWWTSTGGTTINPFNGSSFQLSGTPRTTDIQISAGRKLSGTITDSSGATKLKSIKVKISDAISGSYLVQSTSDDNGNFQIWLPQGKYVASANNVTVQPYGSGWYKTSGTLATNQNDASIIEIAGADKTIDFKLAVGVRVKGVIATDTSQANKLTGEVVRVYNGDPYSDSFGAFVEATRSDADGNYSIMLTPKEHNPSATTPKYAFYTLKSKGMTRLLKVIDPSSDMTNLGSKTQHFDAAVKKISGILKDADGNPVGNAKMILMSYSDPTSTAADSVVSAMTSLTFSGGLSSDVPFTEDNVKAKSYYGLDCTSEGVNRWNPCMSSFEITNSDGSFTVAIEKENTPAKAVLMAVIDDDRYIASSYYKSPGQSTKRIIDAGLIDVSTSQANINFVTSSGASSTSRLSGTITDSSGNPLPNIKVQFRPVMTSVGVDATDYANAICVTRGNTKNGSNEGTNPVANQTRSCGQHAYNYVTTSTDANGYYAVSVLPGNYVIRMQTSNSGYFSNTFRYAWVKEKSGGGYESAAKNNLCTGACNSGTFLPAVIPVSAGLKTINVSFTQGNLFTD